MTDTKKPAKRHRLLIFFIVVFLLVLFLVGAVPRFINTRKINALARQDPLPQVTLLEIKKNTEPIELILPSSAQGWHFTPIWARVTGYLVRYLVDIGDVVKNGDLLAEIDTPETDELLAQAQADLLSSIAERNIAKITYERWQHLWNKNPEAVSKQEVDQYQANLVSAEAIVLANEKNVAKYLYQQKFKYVYAPFDGIITRRFIDIGSLIYGDVNGSPQELFQMVQTHTIRFFVDVPQTYFRDIKEGVEAEVSILEIPDKTFKGSVARYAKALDPTARTLLTQVNVENPEGILYAGLYGQVKFTLHPPTHDFVIPTTAVIIRAGFPHVAVVDENDIAHLRRVVIGHDYGNRMEITSGLKENEKIILIPSDNIREGTKVRVIDSSCAPACALDRKTTGHGHRQGSTSTAILALQSTHARSPKILECGSQTPSLLKKPSKFPDLRQTLADFFQYRGTLLKMQKRDRHVL